MTLKRTTRAVGVAAIVAAAVTVGARQQEIRITQEVMTTNPIGGQGPGGGLARSPRAPASSSGKSWMPDRIDRFPARSSTLGLPGSRPIRALADGQGRFLFRDLPKGRFNLTATKAGYVDGAYRPDAAVGPDPALRTGDGERASGVSMSLWRHAAVARHRADEQGEPVVSTTVRVLRRRDPRRPVAPGAGRAGSDRRPRRLPHRHARARRVRGRRPDGSGSSGIET